MEQFKNPKAKLPKIDEEKLNLSKVAKYISTTGGLVNAENPTELVTIPSKNVMVTVNLWKDKDVALSSSNITLYDLAVMDSVYTLYKNGCTSFTPEMVARVMSGDAKAYVKPQKAGSITKSLRKLAFIRITLDCTEEYKARGIKIGSALFTDYLLPMSEVQLKAVNGETYLDGFRVKEVPILYDYAERTGRIASVPTALLEVPGISDTDDGILVKRYLIQRIEELKKARNKSDLKEIIYYDSEVNKGALSDLWYNDNIKNLRDKKAKLHKMIVKILDSFKSEKYIRGYDILIEGKSVVGVTVEV